MVSHLKSEEDYSRTIYLNFVIKSERNYALNFLWIYLSKTILFNFMNYKKLKGNFVNIKCWDTTLNSDILIIGEFVFPIWNIFS